MWDHLSDEHEIEHRLTKINHPWTNGQVERMNRTIKDATVKRYHHESHDQLREHLQSFIMAYNFAKRLKTLKGLTPYESDITQMTSEFVEIVPPSWEVTARPPSCLVPECGVSD